MPSKFLSVKTVCAVLASLAISGSISSAQQADVKAAPLPPLVIPRIQTPIVLDGKIDEAAWERAEPLGAIGHVPNFGAVPSERTEFRLVHDGEHLFFACRAFTSNPNDIRGLSLERDETGMASDACAIYLDTTSDGENALGFRTNPSGNRSDFHFTGNGATNNLNWNTFWDVAVSRDEFGWSAEFRIPFSSLLFQAQDNHVEMGFTALRAIARRQERTTHPTVSPEWGNFSFARPGVMRRMLLDDVRAAKPLYVTPYLLAGGGYTHALNSSRTAYTRTSDKPLEAGLDVRYGVTSNLTLDLSVNTDFAQVEADDQQVNLTRFSLFFPEKRRFFQERAVNFDFTLGGNERLFHSRNIGLANGTPVGIYGGARLVGRVGDWDVGVLDMQTEDSQLLPSENQGVVRLRRRVLNPYSYVGGILTSRVGTDGSYNYVYGNDAILNLFGDDYLTMNWAQSFDGNERDEAADSPLDRSLYRAFLERKRQDGLAYTAGVLRSGELFEPKMGFLRRRDYTQADGSATYGWRHGRQSRFLSHSFGVTTTAVRRNGDGVWESSDITPRVAIETKSGNDMSFSLPIEHEDLAQSFSLPGGRQVPAGVYDFVDATFRFNASQRNSFRPSVSVEGGQFYDGRRLSVGVTPVWNPSPHFRGDFSYRVDRVSFPTRNDRFTAHVARVRAEWMMSTRSTATTFVQYNSADHAAIVNFRYRYNPREGTDLYFVWNEGLVTDRFELSPAPPFARERTILVKYSHNFTIGF